MRQDPKLSITDPSLQGLFEKVVQATIEAKKGITYKAFGIEAKCEKAPDGAYSIEYAINHEEVKKAIASSTLATSSKMCYFWLMGVEIFKHEDGSFSITVDSREHHPGDKGPRFRIARDAIKWIFQRMDWT